MTYHFGTTILNIEFRNGVGLDIEFCDSRPIWSADADGNQKPMYFEGLAVCIPFFLICFGKIGDVELDN